MSTAAPMLAPIVAANPASIPGCFAIVDDSNPGIRQISGSLTLVVREEHRLVRDGNFQIWCENNLSEGVYGRYDGIDLILYFATSWDRNAAAAELGIKL